MPVVTTAEYLVIAQVYVTDLAVRSPDPDMSLGHRVRIRQVTVRWRSTDRRDIGEPVRHIARTYVTPRGKADARRERLVGCPRRGTIGEVMTAGGSMLMESLRDSDLQVFKKEAREVLERLADIVM